VTDNHYVVQCIATCEEELGGPSTDPPRTAVLEAAQLWIDRLAEVGQPIGGPVRIIATPWTGDPNYNAGAGPWPLQDPAIEDVATPGPDGPESVLVQAADADELRSLRARQVSGEFSEWWLGLGPELPIRASSGDLYSLTVSDVLPFERDGGGVTIWAEALAR
jgi:hypothetical protein